MPLLRMARMRPATRTRSPVSVPAGSAGMPAFELGRLVGAGKGVRIRVDPERLAARRAWPGGRRAADLRHRSSRTPRAGRHPAAASGHRLRRQIDDRVVKALQGAVMADADDRRPPGRLRATADRATSRPPRRAPRSPRRETRFPAAPAAPGQRRGAAARRSTGAAPSSPPRRAARRGAAARPRAARRRGRHAAARRRRADRRARRRACRAADRAAAAGTGCGRRRPGYGRGQTATTRRSRAAACSCRRRTGR